MDDNEQTQRGPSRRWRKLLGGGVSLALLVFILVGVIPQFGSYSGAWDRLSHLGPWSWAAIATVAVLYQISGIWPYQAAIPGLRFGPGLLQIETTTAIANTVPAGGAVAIGMTYRMFSSFGFPDVVVSSAVLTTGVWNFAGKFLLPTAAVAVLAVIAKPSAQVVGVAITGVVAMAVSGSALWLALRSETSARWLGHLGDRIANRVLHVFRRPATDRIERALIHFETQTIHTVRHRGWLLTWATLANQVAGFVLILIIVRAVGTTGGQVPVDGVFASFAVARLAGAIPITPGSLGTFDAAFISTMATFGAHSSEALTADLVWRLTTYFLPILSGTVTYLIWVRWRARSGAAVRPGASPSP